MIYSGYIEIETTGESAYYEFDEEEILDPIQQLELMMLRGIIQIIDNPPRDDEEDY
jgi:hypothetical protein